VTPETEFRWRSIAPCQGSLLATDDASDDEDVVAYDFFMLPRNELVFLHEPDVGFGYPRFLWRFVGPLVQA